jgi:hypothetical protein
MPGRKMSINTENTRNTHTLYRLRRMALMIFKVVVKISAQVAKEKPEHKGHKV